MDEALWALGRGTGVVALVLLTLGVVLGVFTRSGRTLFGLPRFSVAVVHRNVAILASVFTLIHIVTLVFDPFAQLNLVDLVIPFRGAYEPFWLGLGTLGVDLLVAVMFTALLRRWIGVRVFRFVHWFVYAMWPVAFLHAVGMGSDRGAGWFVVTAVLSAIAVCAATAWRLTRGFVELRRVRTGET
jgi:methionine sulfoxide reductase heme-binding subunit